MLSIKFHVDFTFHLSIFLQRLDFGPLTSTLTIEATYSQLTVETEFEAQGTIVLLPVNVITPVVYTLGRYSAHTLFIIVLKNAF